MSKPITKQGKHGTLYRYRIVYRDDGDGGCPDFVGHLWAYDMDGAIERFHDGLDAEGWQIVSVTRESDAPEHRQIAHKGF